MTGIYTYLKDYREEEPEWIARYLRGEEITFKDIMSSRVGFYPRYYTEYHIRNKCDGTLIKVGNRSHSVHSFLYVGMVKRKALEEQIAKENSFHGYHSVGRIEWRETDIMPSGRHQILKPIRNIQETPYCFSIIMERNEDKDDKWGAGHFSVTFLFGISTHIYYWLFKKEYLKAPWIFLLNEHYKGISFERYILQNQWYPQFVIYSKKASIWKGYEKVKDISPVFGEFRRRRDLYSYNTVEYNV